MAQTNTIQKDHLKASKRFPVGSELFGKIQNNRSWLTFGEPKNAVSSFRFFFLICDKNIVFARVCNFAKIVPGRKETSFV